MNFLIKSAKQLSRGFTILEVLVVIGIIGLLASVSISVYNNFRAHENLEIATSGVVEAIRHAQANAQAGKLDSGWGVKILSNGVVIFKGTSYAARDVSFDQSLNFSGSTVGSGLDEIVFTKLTGSTVNTGTITLTNSYEAKNISINAKGTLTY